MRIFPHMQTDLITTREAAEILGTTVSTVNRWAQARDLTPAHEIEGRGGIRLYRRSDVEALAASRTAEAAS